MGLHHCALAGKTVPGTNFEAIIATINTIANQWSQFDGYGTFQFDREIRNASAGIELKGR
jgi:hypothetical protein